MNGRDWHGTVPTRVMSPLLELQKDLHRAYVHISYGSPNLRKLRDEDRDALELVIKVKEGSSDYQAPMWEQLTELGKQAIGKMESRDIVLTVVGVALVWGTVELGKDWIAARQEVTDAEKTVQLSHEETERLKVFAEAMKEKPVLKEAKEDYHATQNRILKTVRSTDTVQTKGVHLRGDEAMEITQEERARSEDIQISGPFRVWGNDASQGDGFRIKVARVSDGLTFKADVPIQLDPAQKQLIQKAEWSKGAYIVHLSITASVLRKSINNAVVFEAKEIEMENN